MDRKLHDRIYTALCVAITVLIIAVLLFTAHRMPHLGRADNPDINEVFEFYIERGPEETGALNTVAGMILHYRAFDTLAETCVLFTAAVCVFVLLRIDGEAGNETVVAIDRRYEPAGDPILGSTFRIIVPAVFMFGIYVTVNGHLSPGGGFSGGAVISAGLLLYLNAYSIERTERFMSSRAYRTLSCGALCAYVAVKSWTFYAGANGLESFENAGVPGNIISAGFIPALNVCVAVLVAMTVYSVYIMIRKGGFNR